MHNFKFNLTSMSFFFRPFAMLKIWKLESIFNASQLITLDYFTRWRLTPCLHLMKNRGLIFQPGYLYQLSVLSLQLVLKKLLWFFLSLFRFTAPTKRERVRSGAARNSRPAPFPDGLQLVAPTLWTVCQPPSFPWQSVRNLGELCAALHLANGPEICVMA